MKAWARAEGFDGAFGQVMRLYYTASLSSARTLMLSGSLFLSFSFCSIGFRVEI